MRNGLGTLRRAGASCHPERAQTPSERSESRNRHPLASRDLHLPRPWQRRNADNNTDFAETAGLLRLGGEISPPDPQKMWVVDG